MGLQTCAKDVTGLDTTTMPSISIDNSLLGSGQDDDNTTDPAKTSSVAETPLPSRVWFDVFVDFNGWAGAHF